LSVDTGTKGVEFLNGKPFSSYLSLDSEINKMSKALLLVLFAILHAVSSFRGAFVPKWHRSSMLKMSTDHKLDIFAKDMELTPSMQNRVNDKIRKVIDKLGHDALSIHVVLKVVKYPDTEVHTQTTKAQIAEVTVQYKGGAVVHVSEGTDDMYSSIDIVSHKLARSIKKHNEKLREKRRRAQKSNEEDEFGNSVMENDFEIDDLVQDLDPKYRNRIGGQSSQAMPMNMVRPKKFPMPPITLDEAIGALEYIDHPFYVFRNKETNEINVVYRRKTGGVGLISPTTEESF
jgi:putative sigma-54 modulation protein